MPNPCYQVYFAAAVFGRAEPVYLRASRDEHLYDLAALEPALLDRTALLYLCSPSNPEGAVASLEALSTAIRLAQTYGFVVCVDECYTDIYDGEPPPGALEACAVLRQGLDNVVVFPFTFEALECAGSALRLRRRRRTRARRLPAAAGVRRRHRSVAGSARLDIVVARRLACGSKPRALSRQV